jgi:hypothetical protein
MEARWRASWSAWHAFSDAAEVPLKWLIVRVWVRPRISEKKKK